MRHISRYLLLLMTTATITKVQSANSVKVTCLSCPDPSKLTGKVGEDLQLKYVIGEEVFQLLTIQYNGSVNRIEISPSKVNTNGVKDTRLKSLMTKGRKSSVVRVTLKSLTLGDDNLRFSHVFMDYNLDEYRQSQTLAVHANPRFCNPPDKTYSVTQETNQIVSFTVCGNPAPEMSAQLTATSSEGNTRTVAVTPVQSNVPYRHNYRIESLKLSPDLCAGSLIVTAKSLATTTTYTSALKLIFTPGGVSGVTARRDDMHRLHVAWEPLVVGDCRVRYHVKRSTNGTTEEHQTTELSYLFRDAVMNNTVSVNAEINGIQGPYSRPIFIGEFLPPVTSSPIVGDEGVLGAGAIVGIVAAVVIVMVLLILFVVTRKRGYLLSDYFQTNTKEDEDEEPFSFHAPVLTNTDGGDNRKEYNRDKNKYNGDYVDVNNIMDKLQEQEQQKRKQQEQNPPVYLNTGPPGGVPSHAPPPYEERSSSVGDSDSIRKSRDSDSDSNDGSRGSYDYADSVIV